jgi:hypothetical protein
MDRWFIKKGIFNKISNAQVFRIFRGIYNFSTENKFFFEKYRHRHEAIFRICKGFVQLLKVGSGFQTGCKMNTVVPDSLLPGYT